mgnify:CR=1 FL=1
MLRSFLAAAPGVIHARAAQMRILGKEPLSEAERLVALERSVQLAFTQDAILRWGKNFNSVDRYEA